MSRRLIPPKLPAVFTPTVSRGMVDDFSLRAARQTNRAAPPGVPMQYDLPLRHHPMWSGNVELGRETPFAAAANNRQMVLKLEEWGAPELWTLMLGLEFTPATGGSNGFAITAELAVGAGGTTQLVNIDWSQGATVTLPMNALTVTAVYDDATDVPSDLVLRATVARGALGLDMPPTASTYVQVDAASQTTIEIPKFARRVFIIDSALAGSSAYNNNLEYFFNAVPGGVARLYTRGPNLLTLGGSLPIPNGARFITIVNNTVGPAPGTNILFLFELNV